MLKMGAHREGEMAVRSAWCSATAASSSFHLLVLLYSINKDLQPLLWRRSWRDAELHKLPKGGVETENNDHIILKWAGQDASVVQFKTQEACTA